MSRESARALPATMSDTVPLQWRHRWDVMRLLVRRDLQLRYRNSLLGTIWAVLLPIAQAAVLVFVFQIVVPLNIEAYPAFVLSALLPWTWFSASVVSATGSLLENRDLVRHPGFRAPVLVMIALLSNLFLYVAALPIMLAVAGVYGRWPSASIVMLPVLIVIQSVLIAGTGLLTATLNVFFRDVTHIVGVVLLLLFYLTPVFYDAPASPLYRVIFLVNPLASLIDGYRAIFFRAAWPAPEGLLICAVGSIVVLGISLLVWRRCEQDVLDTL